MKFIIVKSNKYHFKINPMYQVPHERKIEESNAVFILQKLPSEELPENLFREIETAGTVIRKADGVEYYLAKRMTFNQYVDSPVHPPAMCKYILIRKSFRKGRRGLLKSIEKWLTEKRY